MIMLDQPGSVSSHEAADRTARLDEQDDGSIWPQDEPGGMEVKRLLVDVAADGRRDLSSLEPKKEWIGERMAFHDLFCVLFRVDRKRHHPGADLFEPLNAFLKVS